MSTDLAVEVLHRTYQYLEMSRIVLLARIQFYYYNTGLRAFFRCLHFQSYLLSTGFFRAEPVFSVNCLYVFIKPTFV